MSQQPIQKPAPDGIDLTRGMEPLAKEYGVSERTVARWRREAGVPTPPPGGRKVMQCPPHANLSGSLYQAARRLGVSPPTVRRWKLERGLPIPPVGRVPHKIPFPAHADIHS